MGSSAMALLIRSLACVGYLAHPGNETARMSQVANIASLMGDRCVASGLSLRATRSVGAGQHGHPHDPIMVRPSVTSRSSRYAITTRVATISR